MKKRLLATIFRAAVALTMVPTLLGITVMQGLVVGPLTRNYTVLPNLTYRSLRRLFGYKIELDTSAASLVKDRQVWFVANHMSNSDFVVLGSTLNGTFAGKGDILKWPVVAQMARAVKYIGLRRSKEFNQQSRAKIIKNFNAGANTIMFPEGTTSEGKQVYMFHAGLPTILYGDKGVDKKGKEVALEKEVIVQPIAIRVKKVDGVDAIGRDDLRNLYSMHDEDRTLTRIWRRLQIRQTVIELTVLPPLDPKNFSNAQDLINTAAQQVANIVNPGQTTFEKAVIPVKNIPPKPASA